MCRMLESRNVARSPLPAEGATIRLDDQLQPEQPACKPIFGTRRAWIWVLPWLIWPAILAIKGLFVLAAPLAATFWQPLVFEVSLLPLLLIGAGLFALFVDRGRRRW
jgi:hypothetical protein